MLKDWQIAALFATISITMATCAGGIVPRNACTGTQPYIDWGHLGAFIVSPLGLGMIIGGWIFMFGLVYLLSHSRNN